jgi:hypothetical protein
LCTSRVAHVVGLSLWRRPRARHGHLKCGDPCSKLLVSLGPCSQRATSLTFVRVTTLQECLRTQRTRSVC